MTPGFQARTGDVGAECCRWVPPSICRPAPGGNHEYETVTAATHDDPYPDRLSSGVGTPDLTPSPLRAATRREASARTARRRRSGEGQAVALSHVTTVETERVLRVRGSPHHRGVSRSGDQVRRLLDQAVELVDGSPQRLHTYVEQFYVRLLDPTFPCPPGQIWDPQQMVAATSREVLPAVTGLLCCAGHDPTSALIEAASFGRDTDTIAQRPRLSGRRAARRLGTANRTGLTTSNKPTRTSSPRQATAAPPPSPAPPPTSHQHC